MVMAFAAPSLTPHAAAASPLAPSRQSAADSQRPLWFWLPLAIVAAVLVTVSADPQWAAVGGAELTGGKLVGSTASRQIAFLTLGGLGLVMLYRGPSHPKVPVWHLLLPSGLLFAYLFATIFWSDAPSTTLKRSIVMACIAIAGCGLGRSWSYRQFSLAILSLSLCFLCLSLLAELRYRAFLSDPGDYRFSGIMHPAKQAFNCGLLTLASLSMFLHDRRKLYLWIMAVALAFLLLTKARTGFAATILAAGVLLWPHLSLKIMVPASLATVWILGASMVYLGATGRRVDVDRLATMGRDEELADPTKLTGRLPIWNQALELFAQRPFLGYGYGAFWTAPRLEDFQRRNGWALAHCHSAYLESLVNLGAAGAMTGWLIAALAFVRSIRLSKPAASATARLVAAILTLALISGLTEMAFIGDGFEFFAVVSGIGLLAFQPLAERRALRRWVRRVPTARRDPQSASVVSLTGTTP
ncbi:O-antigen ligase family protein [Roseimaritima ulvae]|uniref:O-Antigen ligase n=1 Tax=Roseimaritima ulvae TaxID=980254 RepID=A0A5B9QYE0_9BACT|nr:O-antigen ligase family protein [Roseimaritima ulvae]QEG38981.1 O-Antigen ligase [Roseimaritima ulvae]